MPASYRTCSRPITVRRRGHRLGGALEDGGDGRRVALADHRVGARLRVGRVVPDGAEGAVVLAARGLEELT